MPTLHGYNGTCQAGMERYANQLVSAKGQVMQAVDNNNNNVYACQLKISLGACRLFHHSFKTLALQSEMSLGSLGTSVIAPWNFYLGSSERQHLVAKVYKLDLHMIVRSPEKVLSPLRGTES